MDGFCGVAGWKIDFFCDASLVGMNGSDSFPAVDMSQVSLMAEGIVPFSTLLFVEASIHFFLLACFQYI